MKKFNIITDCSGIDAPIEALKQLKIPYNYLYGSDIEKKSREFMRINSDPKAIYDDIKKTPKKQISKNIDLYIAGFPCQNFSIINSHRGELDEKSEIFFDCLRTIKVQKPKVFILENVKGLTTGQMKPIFEKIIKLLKDLKVYNIYYKILNTKDFGIPQNRERLYIIGIQKKYDKGFYFPDKKIKLKKFKSFLENPKDVEKYKINETPIFKKRIESHINNKNEKGIRTVELSYALHSNDKFWNNSRINYDSIPCLIRSSRGIYLVDYHRLLTEKELFSFQGFDYNKIKIPDNFTLSDIKKFVGNSMSVPILKSLIKQIFL